MSNFQSKCDHTSVGILVWQEDKLLLIERKKFPFGFASPAGHLDGDTFEEAAKRELREEVGLDVVELKLLHTEKAQNICRREDGSWHQWQIFEAKTSGTLIPNQDETKKVDWYSLDQIKKLANRTADYLAGRIPETDWQDRPGLEPVFSEHLQKLKVL